VAAKKRVQKLEREGIIRGYNTYIYRADETTMFIDIVTKSDKYDEVLQYVSTRTAYIRQIFKTTKENHIHLVAVSDEVNSLKYMATHIQKKFEDKLIEYHCHAAIDIVKDVYGGVDYEHFKRKRSKKTDE
jgi:DNA-binding Lrp family transcriptional regulator